MRSEILCFRSAFALLGAASSIFAMQMPASGHQQRIGDGNVCTIQSIGDNNNQQCNVIYTSPASPVSPKSPAFTSHGISEEVEATPVNYGSSHVEASSSSGGKSSVSITSGGNTAGAISTAIASVNNSTSNVLSIAANGVSLNININGMDVPVVIPSGNQQVYYSSNGTQVEVLTSSY